MLESNFFVDSPIRWCCPKFATHKWSFYNHFLFIFFFTKVVLQKRISDLENRLTENDSDNRPTLQKLVMNKKMNFEIRFQSPFFIALNHNRQTKTVYFF